MNIDEKLIIQKSNTSDSTKSPKSLNNSNINNNKIADNLNKLKYPKKIIKLDKTSVLNHNQQSFISKSNEPKVLTLVQKQFASSNVSNIRSGSSNSPVNGTVTTNTTPANNITNTIFNNSVKVNNNGTNDVLKPSMTPQAKPILVIKNISDMVPGVQGKQELSRKKISNTSTTPTRKPKSKNSSHIKALLSQSEQNIPFKSNGALSSHPITFSIAKKAPTIKILNKKASTQTTPAPSPLPSNSPPLNSSVLNINCSPGVDANKQNYDTIEFNDQIELSVQEVTIESTKATTTQDIITSVSSIASTELPYENLNSCDNNLNDTVNALDKEIMNDKSENQPNIDDLKACGDGNLQKCVNSHDEHKDLTGRKTIKRNRSSSSDIGHRSRSSSSSKCSSLSSRSSRSAHSRSTRSRSYSSISDQSLDFKNDEQHDDTNINSEEKFSEKKLDDNGTNNTHRDVHNNSNNIATKSECLTEAKIKKNNFFKNCDIILHRNKTPKKSHRSDKSRSRSLTKKHKKSHKSKKSHKKSDRSEKKYHKHNRHDKHKSPHKKLKTKLEDSLGISYKSHVINDLKLSSSIRQSQSLPCSPIKTNKNNVISSSKVVNTPERFKNKSKLLDSSIRRNIRLNMESPLKSKKLKKRDKSPEKLVHKCSSNDVTKKQVGITEEEQALFESIMSRELDANGGATVLAVSQADIDEKLHLPGVADKVLLDKFSLYFLTSVYSETKRESDDSLSKSMQTDDDLNESSSHKENDEFIATMLSNKRKHAANYVLGVVRGSAKKMPDLLDYFADKYPQMTVKSSLLLNGKEINTERFSDYRSNVNATYLNGTYRYGPLLQTSLVGVRNEEIGDYFPEFINDHLESNSFLKHVMPWGNLSHNENMNPMNSDDGPIIWARPGEQMIPTSNSKEQQLLSSNMNNLNGAERKKKKKPRYLTTRSLLWTIE